jgi:hypothetical protein
MVKGAFGHVRRAPAAVVGRIIRRRSWPPLVAGVAIGAVITGIALADAGGPPAGGYVAITPAAKVFGGSVGGGKSVSAVAIGGATTVPTNATAVRLSITVKAAAGGSLAVYPAGDPTAAGAASVVYGAGTTTATVQETVGIKDEITFHNGGAASATITALVSGYSTQVTATNIAPDGGSAGQVLGNNGSTVGWKAGSLAVNAGAALTGGGSVPLGGSTTLGVADGGIGTTQLGDGSVTTNKFAGGATAPNASQLGGIGPSGFIQGTGSIVHGYLLLSPGIPNWLLLTVPGLGAVDVACNGAPQYSVAWQNSGAASVWWSHSGGIGFGGPGLGSMTFASDQGGPDLITVHAANGNHTATLVIAATNELSAVGAPPKCTFSAQGIAQ